MNRPIMRYFGGKTLLASRIVALFPRHSTYVEPYCGAASILLAKPRANVEIINDIDGLVVNVHVQIRDDRGLLRELLDATPFARKEYVDAAERTDDPVEQARRTIVRSYMGIGPEAIHHESGFRSRTHNKKRAKDASCAQEWATYLDAWPTFKARLKGVTIENRDATTVMEENDGPDVLHYVDPPYVMDTRGDRRPRYDREMTDDDHRRLLAFLRDLKGMVVLSGYRCATYDEALKDWDRTDFAFRGKVESVWRNPAAMKRRPTAPTLFDFGTLHELRSRRPTPKNQPS